MLSGSKGFGVVGTSGIVGRIVSSLERVAAGAAVNLKLKHTEKM